MLGPPGPWVFSWKHPPPQLTLDLGEQISRITHWKAASSSLSPELTSQERAEGHGAPGSMCRVHPVGTLQQGQREGSSSP